MDQQKHDTNARVAAEAIARCGRDLASDVKAALGEHSTRMATAFTRNTEQIKGLLAEHDSSVTRAGETRDEVLRGDVRRQLEEADAAWPARANTLRSEMRNEWRRDLGEVEERLTSLIAAGNRDVRNALMAEIRKLGGG